MQKTKTNIQCAVGKNIRAARIHANMTQACLAKLVGVHRQTISYLEGGKYPVSVVVFVLICQVLELSPNAALAGVHPLNISWASAITPSMQRKRKPSARDIHSNIESGV